MRKLALLALLALAACNTIAGVGQDITGAANTVAGAI
jgi:predicted small secreted protein